jgi:peptidyl-prolyl cis-trans isomerase SurA
MFPAKSMKKIIILTLIYCLLFTVYHSLSYSAVLLDRVIATVNGEVITWSELRENFDLEAEEHLKGLKGEEKEKKLRGFEKFFLNNMIDLKLQLQEARRLGFSIRQSEIDGAIADIKVKYNLTDESLIESLKAEGFTLDEYRKQLEEQILVSKLVKFEVRDNVLILDKEIEEYYEANKDKYRREEKIRIRQIFFSANPEDISQRAEIEARAQEIIQMIKKGEDFAKIAMEFSEDASREFGGDLGYVSRGSVLKEIEDVATALKVGEVSEPFWSSTGLHIVKLEDKIEGSNIDGIRNRIKGLLFDRTFKLKYSDWLKSLREKAYIKINL